MAYWLDPNADNKGNCKMYMCDTVSDISILPRFGVNGGNVGDTTLDSISQESCSYGSICFCIENGSMYMLTKDTNEWKEI